MDGRIAVSRRQTYSVPGLTVTTDDPRVARDSGLRTLLGDADAGVTVCWYTVTSHAPTTMSSASTMLPL